MGGLVSFVVFIGLTVFYLIAFFDGAEAWFGWSGWWVGAAIIPAIILTGKLGSTFLVVVAGYGLYYVWKWPLWLVIGVCFPGLIAMVFVFTGSIIADIYGRLRR
ncbi:hypothetical protein [Pannonibacter phragmitetus]|uniref:Uncharacterized protein n=1 Tax=Pannonibacter phragmitetus TaxID=121719 RepID=A0A0U3QA19_9HYPH|nr:hypothetical protein [Pannonibacter phragmitetus]ALV29353.1 hypothetical protein APZ00_21825 [Pannonibacter phragmitetus]